MQKYFNFGVLTVPQLNSTLLYFSYIAQIMETTTKLELRREICVLLKHIFTDIIVSSDKSKMQAWRKFRAMQEESAQFWKKFEGWWWWWWWCTQQTSECEPHLLSCVFV